MLAGLLSWFVKGQPAVSLVLLGQDGNRCAIVQQILQAFGGMGRVQRHVAGLGLEDRQQPRQGVETTPGQDCDSPTRSWSSQMSCWAPVREKRAGRLEECCIRSFSWGVRHSPRRGGSLRRSCRMGAWPPGGLSPETRTFKRRDRPWPTVHG